MTIANWSALIDLVGELGLQVRVKGVADDLPDRFDRVFSPVPGYIEGGGAEPVPFREIEVVVINPIRSEHRGARMPPRETDNTEMVEQRLAGLGFVVKREDCMLCVRAQGLT